MRRRPSPVPAVPYKDPNNYVKYSGRLAEELAASEPAGAIWANQFDNVANREGHYRTTGPEIWEQTGGKVDAFICAVGTGGTLAGVALYLKEQKQGRPHRLADPMGAALYNYYEHGELKSEGSSITEGIGQGRITANLEGAPIDGAVQIKDEEALPYIFDLIKEEGLVLGGSSGINIAGAVRVAKDLGPGPYGRDRALRLRHALPEQALQPGVPAREGAAGPRLARMSEGFMAPSRWSPPRGSPSIWAPPTSASPTPPGSCRRPAATRLRNTRRPTSRVRSISTSTTSPPTAAPTRT